MRAIFVLAAILSFAMPQVSRTALELSRDASASISLSAPASARRSFAPSPQKPTSRFSSGCTPPADRPALAASIGSIDYVSAQTCDAPHLDLEGPPLAPRPPPLS